MSYCRWSTDDFQCDLYIYADVNGGWTTHVARNRTIYKEPLPEWIPLTAGNAEAFMKRQNIIYRMIDEGDREPIGLPHDGDTFNDGTPGECADRVEALRALGYRVPQYVVDELRAEQESDEANASS